MDDRTRFRVTGYITNAALVGWLLLAAAGVAAIVVGVRSIIQGHYVALRIAILSLAAMYGVWALSTAGTARLLTNNSKGYRPWQYGMVPRNDAGREAQHFNIPLTHAEAAESFVEPATLRENPAPPNSGLAADAVPFTGSALPRLVQR
jgi:hypothetical protein